MLRLAVKAAYGSVDDVCVGKSRSEYGAAIALVPADASGELSGEGILRVRELLGNTVLRLSIRYEYEMRSVIALTNLLDNTNCWQMCNTSASSF